MAGVTRVGPPDGGDKPRKRGFLSRMLRRATLGAALFSPGAYRVAQAEEKLEQDSRREPSQGIPEADLTDAQREAAARRMKDEDAIRRARGDQ